MSDAVVLTDIRKVFSSDRGRDVVAVERLSLRVGQGEIFSLVGPDGAGKTTTIRMMCGVVQPTEGTITILGLDLNKEKEKVKHHVGYLSQRFSLYGDLTIDENIDFFAEIHHVKNYKQRKEELLQFTRLTPFRDRLAAKLSGGMKQKLALACTLVHTPEVIFLDEPTTGVDPLSRRDFWKILSSLLKSGITIVVSTPYLDEAERSSRIALMNEGKLLACDTPQNIKSSFESSILEIVSDDVRTAVDLLRNELDKRRVQLFGDRIHVLVEKDSNEKKHVTQILKRHHIAISGIREIPASLEDVFISNLKS